MFDLFIHEPLKALRNTTVTKSATYFIKVLRKIFLPTLFIYFEQNPTHPVYLFWAKFLPAPFILTTPFIPDRRVGDKSLGRILKKYLYKNKRLIFRKVAVLEPAILLEMVFTSQVIFSIFIKLFRIIVFTKTLPNACYSINAANIPPIFPPLIMCLIEIYWMCFILQN